MVAGIGQGKRVAPLEYTGTTDSTLLAFWFENCLFKEVKEGSTIMPDNAAFHKKSVLPGLAKTHNYTFLFWPPYSPDLQSHCLKAGLAQAHFTEYLAPF